MGNTILICTAKSILRNSINRIRYSNACLLLVLGNDAEVENFDGASLNRKPFPGGERGRVVTHCKA